MARFSFPVVQVGALLGAAAMVAAGQHLARDESGVVPPQAAHIGEIAGERVEARAETPASSPAFSEPLQRGAAPPRPSPRGEGARGEASAPLQDVDRPAPQPFLPLAAGPGRGAAEREHAQPRLAVIIDDVGHDLETARALMGLPVTLAVLPYAEAAPQIAREARAAGREVFVHLPMEPVGLDDPGPGAVTTALDAADIARRIDRALARVPGAAGLNNHMGSRATRDPAAMAAVFAALAGNDLVFVDSLTHPASIAAEAARAAGLAAFDRDVFLDAPGADPALQIDAALALARSQGRAIAIGHPYPATLDALLELQAKADAAGVELVAVSAAAPPLTPPS